MPSDFLTVEAAATVIGITPVAARKAARLGLLPAQKIGRDWVIARSDAEAYRDTPRRPGRKPRLNST